MGFLLLILDLQSGIDISFNDMLFGEDEMIQRLFYEIRLPRVFLNSSCFSLELFPPLPSELCSNFPLFAALLKVLF